MRYADSLQTDDSPSIKKKINGELVCKAFSAYSDFSHRKGKSRERSSISLDLGTSRSCRRSWFSVASEGVPELVSNILMTPGEDT